MVDSYIFEVPLAPQSAYRPRLTDGSRTVSTDPRYRKWRDKAGIWFSRWLKANHYDLVMFMFGKKSDGTSYKTLRDVDGAPREENTVNKATGRINLGALRGKLRDDFNGWVIDLEFVLERPDGNLKYSPVASQTADLDNYTKGVVDMMFESDVFKFNGFDDRYIQSQRVLKRYTHLNSDEKPHIKVAVRMM